ncbi:MAG TPA: hypothetical protein VHD87_15010 [Acidimicrobiales bacterium]|nr:hypothetical protein [Acidimicrobiales bacterium]
MSRRIGLVGCVKAKRGHDSPARDLYVSPLFAGRRRWVEQTCDEWWILSARFGLVHPDTVLFPYETSLTTARAEQRRLWGRATAAAILDEVNPAPGDVVEIHAGAAYTDFGLVEVLELSGVTVELPAEHLGIGDQLHLYAAGPRAARAVSARAS